MIRDLPPRRAAVTLFFVLVLAAGWLCGSALAQRWGASGCPTVVEPLSVIPAAAQAAPRYSWHPSAADKDQVHLRLGGAQAGTWVKSEGKYYPFDGRGWGPPCPPPVAAPASDSCGCASQDCPCPGDDCPCKTSGRVCRETCRCAAAAKPPKGASPAADGVTNFGVDLERLDREPPRRPFQGGLPDDAAKLRLTVIGGEEEQKAVLADLEGAALRGVRDKVVVNAFAPGGWAARPGFKADGKPTIYIQAPSGKVLHRQDEYRGAEKLAEAIRKADPAYDPRKDPDLNKGGAAGAGPDLAALYEAAKPYLPWAAVAALAYFAFLRKGK